MDGKLAVIGMGTMGSMVMWRSSLLTGGIVGFDSGFPASESTAVGGDTRMFRVAYKEGPQYSSLLQESERLWHELNEYTQIPVLDQRSGGVSIVTEHSEFHRSLLASADATGAVFDQLSRDDFLLRYEQHVLLNNDVGLIDPRAGFIRSELAVLTAFEQALTNGAAANTVTQIDEIIPVNGCVQIRSGNSSWTFEKVVVTSGAWSRNLLPATYMKHLEPRRIALTWYASRNPEQFAPHNFPPFMRYSDGLHMYGAPSVDGNTVKLGGIIPSEKVADAGTMNRELTMEEIARSNEAVRQFFPGLIPYCVRSRAYPDLYTVDQQPLIGWLPDVPGVYVATGFSGKGFKMASGVGEAVAQDLFGAPAPSRLEFANPTRFAEQPWVLKQ